MNDCLSVKSIVRINTSILIIYQMIMQLYRRRISTSFKVKRLVGQSGMSYGSLGGRAITALSQGLARAGTWMNTGEGGLSEYHLKGGCDIIYQIGPGLFGVRDKDGAFSEEAFLNVANYKRS